MLADGFDEDALERLLAELPWLALILCILPAFARKLHELDHCSTDMERSIGSRLLDCVRCRGP
jgi:hypothetical protein